MKTVPIAFASRFVASHLLLCVSSSCAPRVYVPPSLCPPTRALLAKMMWLNSRRRAVLRRQTVRVCSFVSPFANCAYRAVTRGQLTWGVRSCSVGCKRCKVAQGDGFNPGMPACGGQLSRDSTPSRGSVRTHSRYVVSNDGHRVPHDQGARALTTCPAGMSHRNHSFVPHALALLGAQQ